MTVWEHSARYLFKLPRETTVRRKEKDKSGREVDGRRTGAWSRLRRFPRGPTIHPPDRVAGFRQRSRHSYFMPCMRSRYTKEKRAAEKEERKGKRIKDVGGEHARTRTEQTDAMNGKTKEGARSAFQITRQARAFE